MKPADAYILRRHRSRLLPVFFLGVAVGYILALVVGSFG